MTDRGGSEQGNTHWLGETPLAQNGTMTLPKEARRHLKLDLDAPDKVLVFTEPGRVTLTAVPPNLPDELLRLAAELTASDASGMAPSDEREGDVAS